MGVWWAGQPWSEEEGTLLLTNHCGLKREICPNLGISGGSKGSPSRSRAKKVDQGKELRGREVRVGNR